MYLQCDHQMFRSPNNIRGFESENAFLDFRVTNIIYKKISKAIMLQVDY
jgi:hypothetical protein